jgi:hypothetical protein
MDDKDPRKVPDDGASLGSRELDLDGGVGADPKSSSRAPKSAEAKDELLGLLLFCSVVGFWFWGSFQHPF